MLQNVQMKARDGSLLQIIWTYFVNNKLGPIVFISRSVNQNAYIEMLYTKFELFLDTQTTDEVTNLKFQQDNASLHVATRTCKFLEALAEKHRLTIMD